MPKLHTLDAMRWIAAMMVAALHFGFFAEYDKSPNLAVDFFFSLSGFVLAYAYDRRFAQGMTGEQFVHRRFIRLYPLFLVGIMLGLIVTTIGSMVRGFTNNDGPYLLQFLGTLFFLPWPSDVSGDMTESLSVPLNGPYWSLILEIHINVLFAIFFRWLGMRVLTTLTALFATGIIATTLIEGSLATGYLTSNIHFGIIRVCFSFFIGVLICRMRHRIPVPKFHWSVTLAILAVLLAFPAPDPVRWIYDSVCVIVLFPLLILVGAKSQPRSPRMLTAFAWMGGASYALYAIHMPIAEIGHFVATHGEASSAIPYRVWTAPFMAVSIVLAFALDRLFDVPIRRWLRAKLLAGEPRRSSVKAIQVARP